MKQIFTALMVIWLLLIYPLIKYTDFDFIKAFVAGSLISLANITAGYLAIKHGFNKPGKEFLRITIGSMGIRLFLIMVLVFLLLKVFNFDVYGLVISLLLFYFVFMAIEILFLNKKVSTKKER
jgi:hypothetical protein